MLLVQGQHHGNGGSTACQQGVSSSLARDAAFWGGTAGHSRVGVRGGVGMGLVVTFAASSQPPNKAAWPYSEAS